MDLGCGPGLFDFELSKLGHKVLGIDFNIESINYAIKNKKSRNIKYRYENYLKSTFTEKYDAILMIYCDFGALIPDEQNILLGSIYNTIKNDGVFIFDVFSTASMLSKKELNCWDIYDGNSFWCKNPHLLLQQVKIFDTENAVGERYFVTDQKTSTTKEFILWNQYYTKDSIGKLLSQNNFEIKAIHENLINDENSMFIIAKRNNQKC